MFLLEKAQIATVPGDAFGADEYIRISFATSDKNLEKAMDRMEEALKSLH
jgi:aspartate aminotransferase